MVYRNPYICLFIMDCFSMEVRALSHSAISAGSFIRMGYRLTI